ncbi:MAG TPA: amidohydrolase family protein, partial [Longimicrobiales bacterium]|nr:amidohydrolase family protein [Longimicrobiales bacterium]
FPSPPDTPPPPFALTGATLIDGTGAPPISDAAVVMRDGRIACAGFGCPVPDDAEVVDASGKWIVPGIVDAHVHYSQTGWADGRPDAYDARDRFPYPETVRELEARPERFFRSYLCSGVTATFDVGGFPWTWDLRERSRDRTDAPHVAAAGPLLSTRDHWVELPAEEQFLHLSDSAATEEAARYLTAMGTDAVKVWYLVGRESPDTAHYKAMLRIGARVARDAGIPLIVHATGLWQAKDALRAGARLLVHSVRDRPVDAEFLRLAREAGTFYTPTLMVGDGYDQLRNRDFQQHRQDLACVDPSTRRKAFLTDSLPGAPTAEERARGARRLEAEYRLMLRNLATIHDAGIPVAMGTDAGNPLTLHGPAIYREMEAMEEAGLSPMEVLVASTRDGARAMGRGEELGTVEEGRIADLVVLDRNPLEAVQNFRSVALVVRRGEIRTRHELAYPPATGGTGGGR